MSGCFGATFSFLQPFDFAHFRFLCKDNVLIPYYHIFHEKNYLTCINKSAVFAHNFPKTFA